MNWYKLSQSDQLQKWVQTNFVEFPQYINWIVKTIRERGYNPTVTSAKIIKELLNQYNALKQRQEFPQRFHNINSFETLDELRDAVYPYKDLLPNASADDKKWAPKIRAQNDKEYKLYQQFEKDPQKMNKLYVTETAQQNDIFFVLRYDNNPLGAWRFTIENTVAHDKGISISKYFRRQGLGSMLGQESIKRLKTKGIKKIIAAAHSKSLPFVQRLGFQEEQSEYPGRFNLVLDL